MAVTFAPGWIVADFMMERSRVERELCVQRMVPDGQRTCHGECQLAKRLATSKAQEHNLPDQIRSLRIGDTLPVEEPLALSVPESGPTQLGVEMAGSILAGYPWPVTTVPWC
ncbi:MAG: hypothetical protein J5I62_10650 [Flavobacteriales bacterium]|nr:hypothetical protein [Flavobacteriales bacterium]MEB2340595.1 hypothetical protein [Flavobacteriia bacterium]